MKREHKYFKLFSSCIPVKGANRAIIYDLERNFLELIPLDLYDILQLFNLKTSVSELYNRYDVLAHANIDEYLNFLIDKEYGFYCSDKEFDLFPPMSLDFITPNKLSNCIVELKEFKCDLITEIVSQLEKLGCESIQFVSYFTLTEIELKKIFDLTLKSKIKSLEIITKYCEEYTATFYKNINAYRNILTKMIIYEAPLEHVFENREILYSLDITTKQISSFKNCGQIEHKYMSVNKAKFLEAYNHNSCLFKKISIGTDGEIKNCPAMSKSFGNINSISLNKVLEDTNFNKLWSIKKDEIDSCKDCEFRYVCTDCRAFIENPININSKPLKCGYDPYTNVWEEWSSNPLKSSAIKHYSLIKNY